MDLRGNVTKSRGTTELRYRATAENALDARVVELFESRVLPGLAQFSVVQDATGGDEVVFDISRFEPLADYLGKADAATLGAVFSHLRTMLETCLDNHLLLKNVVFEANRVYYDSWSSSVRFVYLPFEGLSPDVAKLRAFYGSIPSLVKPADSASRELIGRYQAYFNDFPTFNPGSFQRFLGELAAAAPRSAGSHNAADAPPKETHPDCEWRGAERPGAEGSPVSRPGEILRLRASRSAQDDRGRDAARGAHARVEPGTTYLGALAFDPGADPQPDPAFDPVDPGTTALDQESPFTSSAPAPAPAPAPVAAPARPRAFIVRCHPSERVEIQGDRFVVGKSKYSDYQVTQTTTVSRSHAVFTYAGGSWYVEDDRSKNGTFLDGRRLDPNVRTRVPNGAHIRMSDEEFTFETD